VVHGLDLTFNNPLLVYDFDRDVVTFSGKSLGTEVQCAISREALDDHFGTDRSGQKGRIEKVRENRSVIEQMARTKFLSWPVEEPEAVLIKCQLQAKRPEEGRATRMAEPGDNEAYSQLVCQREVKHGGTGLRPSSDR
jgi:hypothetical protein